MKREDDKDSPIKILAEDIPQTKTPERNFSDEIQQIGFIPGAPATPPTLSPKQSSSMAALKLRAAQEQIPLISLKLKILLGVLFLYVVYSLISPGALGVRSAIIAGLLIFAAIFYKRDVHVHTQSGDEPDWTWTLLLLIPALLLGFFEINFLWKQRAAAELTREISSNPDAWVQCQRFTPALFANTIYGGFVSYSNRNRSVIQYIFCNHWQDFYASNKEGDHDNQQLWAVALVIHEAIHVAGISDEAVTECLTRKAYPQILKRYEIPEHKIPDYTKRFLEMSHRIPNQYQGGDCDTHPIIKQLPHIFGSSKP